MKKILISIVFFCLLTGGTELFSQETLVDSLAAQIQEANDNVTLQIGIKCRHIRNPKYKEGLDRQWHAYKNSPEGASFCLEGHLHMSDFALSTPPGGPKMLTDPKMIEKNILDPFYDIGEYKSFIFDETTLWITITGSDMIDKEDMLTILRFFKEGDNYRLMIAGKTLFK